MPEPAAPAGRPVLQVSGVDAHLGGLRRGTGRQILHDASLDVGPGEIVALIGETGSGKTTLARSIVGLVQPERGSISLDGEEISGLRGQARRRFRRRGEIQFVFQDPLRSLDPDFTVERIVGQGLLAQGRLDEPERRRAIAHSLELVGLSAQIADRRPGQISGGQRQRVAIARALVMEPKLLILDEPVSALDASTRNHVLTILTGLRERLGLAMLIISHDLASLAGVADRVVVLYRGHVVEEGPLDEIFATPGHPYSALLLASAPHLAGVGSAHLPPPAAYGRLEGDEPRAVTGCSFTLRCPFASATCLHVPPPAVEVAPRWRVACHYHDVWPDHVDRVVPHESVG